MEDKFSRLKLELEQKIQTFGELESKQYAIIQELQNKETEILAKNQEANRSIEQMNFVSRLLLAHFNILGF